MVKIYTDTSEADAALGFIDGLVTAISTDRYMDSVTDYTHGLMAQAFDEYVDPIAMGNKNAFNHVYEARRLGLPSGRLWKHTIQGGGRYQKIATFKFLPSTEPILKPSERRNDESDPMYHVPDEAYAKLKQRNYTFTHKATIMEYGLPAVVRPTQAKFLFVPTLRHKGNVMFSKATPQDFSRANSQDSSGGAGTLGRFTALWTEWWKIQAPAIWDSQVRKTIEHDLGRSEREMIKVAKSRRRSKSFKMSVYSAQADFNAGGASATGTIDRQRMSYERASRYIDKVWIT